MDSRVTALERAFQLARTGKYPTVEEIKRQLRREGYVADQVEGPSLVRQLMAIINPRGPMPRGPKGQKRPPDVIGNAVKVMRIATGEEEDTVVDDGKDPAAKSLGSRGGKARAESLSPKRRSEIAKRAAAKRWKRKDG